MEVLFVEGITTRQEGNEKSQMRGNESWSYLGTYRAGQSKNKIDRCNALLHPSPVPAYRPPPPYQDKTVSRPLDVTSHGSGERVDGSRWR